MPTLPPHRLTRVVLRRLGPVAGAPLLLLVVLVALPWWLVSALTRLLRRLPGMQPDVYDRNLVEFAEEVGARPRAHLDVHSRAEDVFHLTTDADGWRSRTPLSDADAVLIGDSFAFGYGVDDADVLTEADGRVAMAAVASPAYSMVHGLLWMQRLAPRLAGRHVVWLVYTGNDLSDNLHPDIGTYRMPFVRHRDGCWEVVTEHVSPAPWTFRPPPRPNLHLFAEFSTPGPYSDRVFSAARYLVGRAAATCAGTGASLTVVTAPPAAVVRRPADVRARGCTPDDVDLDLPDRRLGEACRSQAVGFLPLRHHLSGAHYFEHDMHWNRHGHRAAARVIGDRLTGEAPRSS